MITENDMYRESDSVSLFCAVKGCEQLQTQLIILLKRKESDISTVEPTHETRISHKNILPFCDKHAQYMWDALNANISPEARRQWENTE